MATETEILTFSEAPETGSLWESKHILISQRHKIISHQLVLYAGEIGIWVGMDDAACHPWFWGVDPGYLTWEQWVPVILW